ncbi:chromosome segregation protein SMC [Candidatus Woesearchaeota archaeon]|nr:chromosome segregation protein SMC [Candidatus Woesearchaeota archaeon]
MTKIKSLTLNGFKSFAKKTEIPFGDKFNIILGPNGSGKCVRGDTLVQLSDGSLVPIGELVEKKIESNKVSKIDDGFIALGGDTEILALDTDCLKIGKKKIEYYVKREAPKNLLHIRTRSGREIVSTEYHPLFVLKEGKVEPVKAESLMEGLRIAVPRQIEVKPKTKYFFELLDLIKVNDSVYVPYNEEYVRLLKWQKNSGSLEWKELAKKVGIPLNCIKGLLDKQSINFAYLIRILRYLNLEDKEIINLVTHVCGRGKNYRIPWKNSKEFARFFGYLLAEGRLPPTTDQIWFTNADEEIVKDYSGLVEKLFGEKPTVNEYKAGCWDVLAYAAPVRKLLTKFGMSIGPTKDKNVTDLFLKHSGNEELGEFLNGLYSGDGYVSKKGDAIEIATKSKKLGAAIENILLRLGIISSAAYRVKIATNSGFSGIYRIITVYGTGNIKRFNDNVHFIHKQKKERITLGLQKKCNPNVDLIEVNALIKDVCKELGISIKNCRKNFPKLDAYCYNQCLPSRSGLKEVITELIIPQSEGKQLQSLLQLQQIAESDIFWDEIIEINRFESEDKWVYDLCVEKDHNFIANNIFVHNSNLCDALCFVLGKGSTKDLRAEKSANMIYNGGKKGSPAKDAEVAITFDNSQKNFPLEANEIAVSRVVKQSGVSTYRINGEVRTKQQVLDLLKTARIDPDGHNIILQGDIVQFTEMKPVEKRELVEEVAGISMYEEKKEKSLHELEKVQAKLNEADIILTEREKTLSDLKKDRDQAIQYRELEKNVERNKATSLSLQIKNKEEKLGEEQATIQKHDEAIKKIEDEIAASQQEIQQKTEEIKKINIDLEEKGDKKQKELTKEADELKTDIIRKETRISVCENELKKIKDRKEQLKKSLEETSQGINSFNEKRKALISNGEILLERQKKIEQEISVYKEKHGLKDASGYTAKLESLEKELEAKEKAKITFAEQKQEITRLSDKATFEFGAIQKRLGESLKVKKEDEQKLVELKKLKTEFGELTKDLSKSLNESSVFSSQLASARNQLLQDKEDLAKIRATHLGIKDFLSADVALTRIKESKISGIHGTVNELGEVNSKYALALEVAAGPRIKSFVVTSDVVAAKCISLLKETKSGVLTFLPLNKMKERVVQPELKSLASQNGVLGLATDLVKFDSKFKTVFDYVFGQTLVVENLAIARQLGIGRARMVTLEGDLLEPSGAMIGGFRRKTGIGFKEKEVSEKIDTLTETVSEFEAKVKNLENKKVDVEEKVISLRERKAVLEAEINNLQKGLGIGRNEDSLGKEGEEIEKKLKIYSQNLASINQSLDKEEKTIISLKNERAKLRETLSSLNNPEVATRLTQLEDEREKARTACLTNNSEMQTLNSQKEMIQKETERTQNILKETDKEKGQFTNELTELGQAIKDAKNNLKNKEGQQKNFYKEYETMYNHRKKCEEQIQKIEQQIIRNEEKSKAAIERRNDLSVKKALLSGELEGLKREFEPFKEVQLRRGIALEDLNGEIKSLEHQMKAMGGVNLRALEIYEKVDEEYKKLLEKYEKLKQEKEDVLNLMYEVESKKKAAFLSTFKVLAKNFREIFSKLSTKGEAQLVLENEENPLEGGLDIEVRVVGNKFLDIRSLSGGEKTMAALAFIFSIQDYSPAAFYFLDEVDAALDKHNSELLGQLIQKYSSKAQYIVISHNDNIISDADQIYGVSMQEGVSKVFSLKV